MRLEGIQDIVIILLMDGKMKVFSDLMFTVSFKLKNKLIFEPFREPVPIYISNL